MPYLFRRYPWLRAVLLGLLAALVVAGCGTSKSVSGTASTPPAVSQGAAAASSGAALAKSLYLQLSAQPGGQQVITAAGACKPFDTNQLQTVLASTKGVSAAQQTTITTARVNVLKYGVPNHHAVALCLQQHVGLQTPKQKSAFGSCVEGKAYALLGDVLRAHHLPHWDTFVQPWVLYMPTCYQQATGTATPGATPSPAASASTSTGA